MTCETCKQYDLEKEAKNTSNLPFSKCLLKHADTHSFYTCDKYEKRVKHDR